MLQFLFISLSAVFVFIAHYFVYSFLLRFFSVSSFSGKLTIAIVLTFLFIGTAMSAYVINMWDNAYTRISYVTFASWMGILVNIVLIAIFIYLLKAVLDLLQLEMSIMFFRIVFLSLVVMLSSLGFYQAFSIKVTNYEVDIIDLPDSWDGNNIVHISDVHLGPVYREKFLNKVVRQINNQKPEAVFISGDFFDGMEADFSWLSKPLDEIRAHKGVFYGFGNHDLYLGFDYVVELLGDKNLTVLDNKMVEVDGLQIIGVNYSFNNDFNLEKEIIEQAGYDVNKPSILIFHAPLNIDYAKSAGIDLQLSGHTHNGQLFPFNFLAKWAHKGYGYGLFREEGYNLVVSSGVGTWGPPMRTSGRAEIVNIKLNKINSN